MNSQYNEEEIIINFFQSKRDGFLVDIGAVDGVINSNSRFLIQHLGWNGLLVEPNPETFTKLNELYFNISDKIKLESVAIFNEERKDVDFHIYGHDVNDSQGSTISNEFRERAILQTGDKYTKTIKIHTITLKTLFTSNHIKDKFDFLSVDCEGTDYEVLSSNDWNTYRPKLICFEASINVDKVETLLRNNDYVFHDRTLGNIFYKDNRSY